MCGVNLMWLMLVADVLLLSFCAIVITRITESSGFKLASSAPDDGPILARGDSTQNLDTRFLPVGISIWWTRDDSRADRHVMSLVHESR